MTRRLEKTLTPVDTHVDNSLALAEPSTEEGSYEPSIVGPIRHRRQN